MAFTEKQLGQSRADSTNAVSVYSPGASTITVIKEIWLCNQTNASVYYYLYCDDDGTTYDETTTLAWYQLLEAYETRRVPCFISMNNTNGNFAYKSSTASAITITIFGAEIT